MDSILIEFNKLYDSLIEGAIDLIPKLLLAIIVFFIGFLMARLVQKLINRTILYLHRNINEQLKARRLAVDLQSSARFISKTFFWVILIFSIVLATQILGLAILTRWFDGLILYVPNILASVIIVFGGFIVGELASNIIASTTSRTAISNGRSLGRFSKYIILFISCIIAIDQIGIDILFLTNLLTIAVALALFGAALAFGLGAKTSVSNILGSYYFQKTYQVGSTIQIGEIEGLVIKITATTVVLKTKYGEATIPSKNFHEEKTVLIKKS